MQQPIALPLVDGDTFFSDNSFLELLSKCHRAGMFYSSMKRQLAAPKNALEFGRIIHKALEIRYKSEDINKRDAYFPQQLDYLSEAFDQFNPGDDYRNYDFAVRLISEYNDTYQFEEMEVIDAEIPFALPLDVIRFGKPITVFWYDPEKPNPDGSRVIRQSEIQEIKIIWMGRIDLAFRRLTDNQNFIMDHKTSSVITGSYFKEYELNSAQIGYVQAAENLLGRRISGYQMNVLATRKVNIEFYRKPFTLEKWKFDEWHLDALFHLRRYFENIINQYTPKTTSQCIGKYGVCQYHDVCTLPFEQRPMMLNSAMFEDVTWDPTED